MKTAALHVAARSRHGLAPLEFVLWLPVLLSVTALMVVFGTMAAWRVRGEVVARDAVWRARWPRTGRSEPRPPVRIWPADADVELTADDPYTSLDLPAIDRPVVRGPLPNGFVVHDTLEPTRGAVQGESEIVREFPLIPKLGPYRSGRILHPLLGQERRIAEMGAPNEVRRTLILYELPKTDPEFPAAFARVVERLVSMPNFSALDVLDADQELRKYTGHYVDFHPRVSYTCALDREQVRETRVRPLVDHRNTLGEVQLGQISRLPRTMTNYFLSVYRARIAALEGRIEQMQRDLMNPSGQLSQAYLDAIPGLISAAQAEIAILKPKVEQLEAYQARLDEIEDQLRSQAAAVLPP